MSECGCGWVAFVGALEGRDVEEERVYMCMDYISFPVILILLEGRDVEEERVYYHSRLVKDPKDVVRWRIVVTRKHSNKLVHTAAHPPPY